MQNSPFRAKNFFFHFLNFKLWQNNPIKLTSVRECFALNFPSCITHVFLAARSCAESKQFFRSYQELYISKERIQVEVTNLHVASKLTTFASSWWRHDTPFTRFAFLPSSEARKECDADLILFHRWTFCASSESAHRRRFEEEHLWKGIRRYWARLPYDCSSKGFARPVRSRQRMSSRHSHPTITRWTSKTH